MRVFAAKFGSQNIPQQLRERKFGVLHHGPGDKLHSKNAAGNSADRSRAQTNPGSSGSGPAINIVHDPVFHCKQILAKYNFCPRRVFTVKEAECEKVTSGQMSET